MSSSEFRAGMRREQRASSTLRARLLRQARVELLHHGVDGVGTERLTAAAGLPRGCFYRCFTSWESLLGALLAEAVAANGAAVERALGVPEDPAVTVACLVRQTVRTTERDPLLARLAEAGRAVADAVTDDFSRRVLRSLSRGVWVGRFPVASALVHLCAIRGAVFEVLRGRLDGRLPPAAADELAAGVLQMLGLPAGEAAAIANAPLAEVEPHAAQRRGAPPPKLVPL